VVKPGVVDRSTVVPRLSKVEQSRILPGPDFAGRTRTPHTARSQMR
jgi:hypothetical protein